MKKVVLSIDSWYPLVDGCTNVVLNYDKWLNKNNKSIIVTSSFGEKLDLEGEERYYKNLFHCKSKKYLYGKFYNPKPQKDEKLKAFLDDFKPQLIHAHSPFALLKYFNTYGKEHKIPIVFTFHTKFKDEFYRFTHSHILTKLAMNIMMGYINNADYVWAVSKYAADVLKSYGYKKDIRIVHNAIDLKKVNDVERNKLANKINEKYGILPDENVLLYAGRVVKNKNIEFNLKVAQELKKRNFKFKFLIVGDGEIEKFKKKAKKLNIENEVKFIGPIYDRTLIAAFYSRAHIVLMPSTFDTISLIPMEAGSYKTPIIAASHSCYSEIIESNINGYIRDLDVKQWADCVQTSFTDKNYLKIQQNCQKMVVNWDEKIFEINKLYDEIIADYNLKHKK